MDQPPPLPLYVPGQAAQGLDLLTQTQIYTDITVEVCDLASGHCVFRLQSHRLILYAASLHFRRALAFAGQSQQVLRLFLDCGVFPEALVRLFFRLLYVTVFDAQHLSARDSEAIGENVLFLYQLATQYLVDALRAHCESLLYASFSLDHFKLLSDYVLVPSAAGPAKLSVMDERIELYARYLQWYQCCVERDNNRHYTALQLSPCDCEQTINRHYFSCNKAEILDELRLAVDNVAQCRIPRHAVQSGANGARHLEYYRSVCHDCVRRSSVHSPQYHYSNIGCLRKHYANGTECYAFRLRRARHTPRHCALELCLERRRHGEQAEKRARYDDEASVLEGLELLDDEDACDEQYSARCEVTLLSKRLCLARFAAERTERRTGHAEEVCALELDERGDCYVGRCQQCHHSGVALHILLIAATLQRQKSDPAMSIETS